MSVLSWILPASLGLVVWSVVVPVRPLAPLRSTISEVDSIELQHIDFETRALAVPGTKTPGSRRRIPIHARLLQELEREPLPPTGPVAKRWSNCRRELAAACAKLRLERVSPNDLRRTFASWLKQAGVDSFVVAQLLGHSSSRMVELVYGRLDFATLERAVGELPSDGSEYLP